MEENSHGTDGRTPMGQAAEVLAAEAVASGEDGGMVLPPAAPTPLVRGATR